MDSQPKKKIVYIPIGIVMHIEEDKFDIKEVNRKLKNLFIYIGRMISCESIETSSSDKC